MRKLPYKRMVLSSYRTRLWEEELERKGQLPSFMRSRSRPRVIQLSSISVNDQLCSVLDRGEELKIAQDPASGDWPDIDQYATWCDCSPEILIVFTNGYMRRLESPIMDQLLFLTGLHPHATEVERKQRIVDANKWMGSAETRKKYPEMTDYLVQRHRLREAFQLLRDAGVWPRDRSDPDPRKQESDPDPRRPESDQQGKKAAPKVGAQRRTARAWAEESISINDQLRRKLQRDYDAQQEAQNRGARSEWPSVDQYADWCDCSPHELGMFTSGRRDRLPPHMMDTLLFLTGVHPSAGKRERLERISDANDWWDESFGMFPELNEYLVLRYLVRYDLPIPTPSPIPETDPDWYEEWARTNE